MKKSQIRDEKGEGLGENQGRMRDSVGEILNRVKDPGSQERPGLGKTKTKP